MKKKWNRILLFIMSFIMSCSFVIGLLENIDYSWLKVTAEYSKAYTALNYEELDSLSYRESISADAPQITVFTHGLRGSLSHWSNDGNGNFVYQEHSMIEQLRKRLEQEGKSVTVMTVSVLTYNHWDWDKVLQQNASSLTAEASCSQILVDSDPNSANEATGFRNIYALNNVLSSRAIQLWTQDTTAYDMTKTPTDSLTKDDVEKHIILLFNSSVNYASNDFVYAELEYILDSISYQYRQLTGKLPTYNLIAHSRGGITNLQYALAHPYNVASLYSMGTPYNGSAFGSTSDFFLSLGGFNSDDIQYADGKNQVPGVLDILNSDLSESYKNYWNNNYDIYKHIKFTPIGSYVTLGFVLQLLTELIPSEVGQGLLRGLLAIVEPILSGSSFISGWFAKKVISATIDVARGIVKNYLDVSFQTPILRVLDGLRSTPILHEHIGFSFLSSLYYADDLFIDLDSQTAYGYEGAKVKVKLMDTFDQITGQSRKSVNSYGVAHNLETQDPNIVNFVVYDLDIGVGELELYEYRYTEAGYYITNKRFQSNSSTLTIPSEYNGKAVIGIDSLTRDAVVNSGAAHHTEITKLIIPSTIKEISQYAFVGMNKLVTVEFETGNAITTINTGTFADCSELQTISLPSTVTEIGEFAFKGCEKLGSFSVSDGITSIGRGAFLDCRGLNSINVSAENAQYSSLNGVLCNKSGTELLHYPEGKGTSYTVPSTITRIGAAAFFNNTTLVSLDLNQVTKVKESAFGQCLMLSSITADNLKYVEGGAFEGSAWLKNQTNAEARLGKVLIAYLGNATELVLQDLISIAPFAFNENTTLQSITLNDELEVIGLGAFQNCSNLISITLPFIGNEVDGTDNTHFGYIFGSENYEEQSSYIPASLKEVKIKNGAIDSYAFYKCVNITSIQLPSGISNIREGTFYGCSGLTNIMIPGGVNSIGNYAFANCTNLQSVSFATKTSIDGGTFTSIGKYAFANCSELRNVTLPSTTTSIGNYAFSGCIGFTHVSLPSNVTQIGVGAYADCSNVTEVGVYADSSNMTGVLWEPSLKSIGGSAFENCSSLEQFNVPITVTSIGYDAFKNCTGLKKIIIFGNQLAIGNTAFSGCTGLTSVVLPSGLTGMGANVFLGCDNLTIYTSYASRPTGWSSSWNSTAKRPVLWGCTLSMGRDASSLESYYVVSFTKTSPLLVNSSISNSGAVNGISAPERDSYEFLGWYDNTNFTGTCISAADIANAADGIYYARWSDTYMITYRDVGDMDFSGTHGAGYPMIHTYGVSTELVEPTKEYYTFGGWYKNSNGTGNAVTSLSATGYASDIILYAKWIPEAYAIIYRDVEDADFSGIHVAEYPVTHTYGTETVLLEPIKNGFTFVGWYLTSDGSGEAVTSLSATECTSDITLYAKWEISPFIYTLINDGTAYEVAKNPANKVSGSLTIPETYNGLPIERIATNGFKNCSEIINVVIPANIVSIGEDAFYGCTALTEIDIPSSVTNIGQAIFAVCTNLTRISVDAENSVYLSDGNCIIRKTDNALVVGCNYSIIPDYVTGIGDDAFYYCRTLTNVTLPDSVTTIGAYAFYNCNALTGIVLPASLSDIGTRAFAYCDQLTAITIPASVVNIGRDAFFRCNKLTQINVHENNSEYSSIDGVLFNKAQSVLLRYPLAKTGSYVVPDSVASIESYAFSECALLESVTFMENSMLANIGEAAFADCSKLETVTFAENSVLTELWSGIFANCNALKSINLPLSVTSIECGAFEYCTGLESIVIPEGVTYMGSGVFSGWTTSQSIYVEADVSVLEYWDANWSDECYAMIYWEGYNEVYTAGLEFSLINGVYEVSVGTSLENGGNTIIIPSIHQGLPVRKIADGGFAGCSELVKVMMVQNGQMMEIGEYAFEGCSALKNINIPEGVRTIQAYAFYGCTSLENIVLPSGLRYLWENAFTGCNQLKSITIADSEVSIADSVFEDCGCTIYAEATSAPTDWLFMELSTNYNIIWNCTLATEDTYVVSIEYTDENIYNSDPLYPPYREGYTFVGWATEEAGEIKYAMEDLYNGNVADGTILYAIWIPD